MKKSKWFNFICILCVTAVIVLVVYCIFRLFSKVASETADPPAAEVENVSMDSLTAKKNIQIPDWITQDLLTPNEYSRPQTELTTVNGVVVHYVGNPNTTAQENRDYFESLKEDYDGTGTAASCHFVIGIDGTIIQLIPLDEISYCSNDRNIDTIAIECCHPDETGEFTEETYAALVKLTKWLCEEFELDTSTDVIRHYDVTGKICPKYYVENQDAWDEFIEILSK